MLVIFFTLSRSNIDDLDQSPSLQDSLHATQAQQLPEDIEHEGRNPTFLLAAF